MYRILIVDDEDDVRSAWKRSLRMAGYIVDTAASGPEALRLCERNSYDVVILDFLMPAMSGVELLMRLRKILPLIKSIIVSGKIEIETDESDVADELSRSLEADRYFHKPVRNQALLDAVEELVTAPSDESWRGIAKKVTRAESEKLKTAKRVERQLKKSRRKKRS